MLLFCSGCLFSGCLCFGGSFSLCGCGLCFCSSFLGGSLKCGYLLCNLSLLGFVSLLFCIETLCSV